MPEVSDDDVLLLDRPVIFVEPDEIVGDDDVSFDEPTTEYVVASVEDDYDELIEVEQVDDTFIPTEEILLLDTMRITGELEVA